MGRHSIDWGPSQGDLPFPLHLLLRCGLETHLFPFGSCPQVAPDQEALRWPVRQSLGQPFFASALCAGCPALTALTALYLRARSCSSSSIAHGLLLSSFAPSLLDIPSSATLSKLPPQTTTRLSLTFPLDVFPSFINLVGLESRNYRIVRETVLCLRMSPRPKPQHPQKTQTQTETSPKASASI